MISVGQYKNYIGSIPGTPTLQLRVNVLAGDTVVIPHLHDDGAGHNYVYNYIINFGDFTPNLPVVAFNDPNCSHTYARAGTYIIRISGTCETLYVNGSGGLENFLTSVVQWGMTGLLALKLMSCMLCVFVPPDTLGSFSLITSMDDAFNTTQLSSVPKDLFKFGGNIKTFKNTFYVQNIVTIPSGFFDACVNATSFEGTFYANLIDTIPDHLFDFCPLVTTFESCFAVNQLTAIPINIFKFNPNLLNVAHTFEGNDPTLLLMPNMFNIGQNPLINNFTQTFYNCTGIGGNAESIWGLYPLAAHNLCFHGDNGFLNWAAIPAGWK
jgi:hypothetical protein